ncbi:hypothetical protein [Planctomicrobium sp. SH527]|uniref:hypothetical protein n=1 Tax=Planctomicrobium sp. SH527 TaxID=3448123 RepID=UPI003F5C4F0F
MLKPPLFLLLFFSLAGCGPVSQPVWNHDSRSFFYTQSDGAILQYDVEKRATRTLLAAGDPRPRQVALGTSVPTVSFAQAAFSPRAQAVQVGVKSLLDGQQGWSNLEVWGDAGARRELAGTACYHSPKGNRILIWSQHLKTVPELIKSPTPFGVFFVYDVPSNELIELKTTPPAMPLLQMINVSPFLPDGSGYLGLKLMEDQPLLVTVTWDGWETPLVLTPELRASLRTLTGDGSEGRAALDPLYPLPQGSWSKKTLRFATRKGTVCLDTGTHRGTLEPLSEPQQAEYDQIIQADKADFPWMTLQVARFSSGPYSLHFRQQRGRENYPARVELVDSRQQRRRVLLEALIPEEPFCHYLHPSPDGKLILACSHDGYRQTIHVIQPDGEILVKIDAGPVNQSGESS